MLLSKMADLVTLVDQDIPEGRNSLQESHTNLERVAEYCETKYFQVENKRAALEETKNYTTQSLASVAYQINTLAFNFLQMLDLQTAQLAELESNINHISEMIMIHKEKVARREIGVLTTSKNTTRQHRIIAPANQERPIKYIRKPIDYSVLDDVGHGVKIMNNLPRAKRLNSSGSSSSSSVGLNAAGVLVGGTVMPAASAASIITMNGQSGPPPTTKPPTPPQTIRPTGTLSKGSREYRTLAPPVAPPQVPSNYAPNYPIGHPRALESRRNERGSGYGTLPNMSHSVSAIGNVPQVGMVHPMVAHNSHHTLPPPSPIPPPPPPADLGPHNISYMGPPPPTPPPPPVSSVLAEYDRLGNISPPLPPPPEDDSSLFMANFDRNSSYLNRQRGDDEGRASWIPATYLEKVVAIYDYAADKDDELSFSENSVIYVIKRNDDGWYEGILDGVTGLFPGNYVEPCL